jgi:hypothetical protein
MDEHYEYNIVAVSFQTLMVQFCNSPRPRVTEGCFPVLRELPITLL